MKEAATKGRRRELQRRVNRAEWKILAYAAAILLILYALIRAAFFVG